MVMQRRAFFSRLFGASLGSPALMVGRALPAASDVGPFTEIYANRAIDPGETITFPDGSTSVASCRYAPGCQLLLADYSDTYRPSWARNQNGQV